MIYTIITKSKNKKSILIFLSILYFLLNKLNIIIKLINKENKLVQFALLKSPYIHKIAQHHFGFKFYRKKIILLLIEFFKFVLFIKVFTNKLFHDIIFIICYSFYKKYNYILIKNLSSILLQLFKFNNMINYNTKLDFLFKQIFKTLNVLNFSIVGFINYL